MFVLLLASIFGFAQDQDGAIERVARAEQAYHQRLSEVATAFEQIEAKVGAAEVAELFVAQAVRAQREALDRASEGLSKLSPSEAELAFLHLESVSDSSGSVWLRRVLR